MTNGQIRSMNLNSNKECSHRRGARHWPAPYQ